MKQTLQSVWIAFFLLQVAAIAGAEQSDSRFLSDYSKLQTSPSSELTRYYLAPDAQEKLGDYDSIMVDQPEIFLSDDSPYKGIKPAKLNVIAEAFRDNVIVALSEDYTVVEQPGPATLHLRLALTDFSISKNKTRLLGYTPVGLVYKAGRHAVQSDYQNAVRQVSLIDLKIEGEVTDSESSALLGEFVDDHSDVETPQTWDELLENMQQFGEVISCQLENARSGAQERVNCRAEDEPVADM